MVMDTRMGNRNSLCPILGHLFSATQMWIVKILGLFNRAHKTNMIHQLALSPNCKKMQCLKMCISGQMADAQLPITRRNFSFCLLGLRAHSNPGHSKSFE